MTKNEITWAIHYKVKRSLKMLAQRCNAIMFELIVGLMWVAFAQKNRKDEFIYIIKYQKIYLKILKEMIKCKKIRFPDGYSPISNAYLATFCDQNIYIVSIHSCIRRYAKIGFCV